MPLTDPAAITATATLIVNDLVPGLPAAEKVHVQAAWEKLLTRTMAHIPANGQIITNPGQLVATPDTLTGTTTAPGTGSIL